MVIILQNTQIHYILHGRHAHFHYSIGNKLYRECRSLVVYHQLLLYNSEICSRQHIQICNSERKVCNNIARIVFVPVAAVPYHQSKRALFVRFFYILSVCAFLKDASYILKEIIWYVRWHCSAVCIIWYTMWMNITLLE